MGDMKFGGGDTRSIRWLAEHKEFRITPLVKKNHDQLLRFLRQEYLEKGAALFGRQTPDSIEDFRRAAGGELDNCSDEEVGFIIQDAVQTIRNQSHMTSLIEARMKYAEVVAIGGDQCACNQCRQKHGSKIRVRQNADDLPPFHKGCRCRIEGYFDFL